ncbi:hypothetical protein SNOG_14619 [Parastagonospora nodorum SN15]|uniref:Uncharacterized protein n=1 Tax=Phaeosphaeria nodorum (strain SN15 / ATCC MYA-4574 / FGSC 10173) TaxID=321614 RepID=Q0U0B2_PHANO|nr:hypothetical protein SNOG_14619 [Parastagonospora nodorum SN15]EAT77811.1 hypothetical protein SNOG_14619 [Parastagonospora nodorum SN15]
MTQNPQVVTKNRAITQRVPEKDHTISNQEDHANPRFVARGNIDLPLTVQWPPDLFRRPSTQRRLARSARIRS